MNINCSNIGYQQSPNFNGSVEKSSAKLAKKIGGNLLETMESKAKQTSKNTVIRLDEMGNDYGIFAFNKKTGYGLYVGKAPAAELTKTMGYIQPERIDEGIVNASIKHIKEAAIAGTLNSTEKKMLRQEVKDTLAMQRELGMQQPFWNETKQLMAEAEERAAQERVAESKNYHEWKMSMCNEMI